MARVFFTANLRRHVDCASMDAEGTNVREVLARVFAAQDRLGAYVLDDQGALRKHMTILVDGSASATSSGCPMRWAPTVKSG